MCHFILNKKMKIFATCYSSTLHGANILCVFRLPVFMNQLRKFLEVCKQHCSALTPSQRYEIATYMVPEVSLVKSQFLGNWTLTISYQFAGSSCVHQNGSYDNMGGGENIEIKSMFKHITMVYFLLQPLC